MRLITEIGERKNFVLAKAILMYQNTLRDREVFATVHDVIREGAEPQQPKLGPGSLLDTAFLHELCARIERPAKALLLPENVLVYTSELLIWWTPPRLHSMYFSEGAEDRQNVDGRVCPHPALLWKVHRGSLFLRALSHSVRPQTKTPLMVAPYWNTQAGSGNVCEGSMPRPGETDLSNLLEWEEGFFNSRFTHPSGIGTLTSHPGGFMGLWTELAGQKEFPSGYLAAAGQTLQQFIE